MQARRPDNPGKQYNPYGTNPTYVQPTLASNEKSKIIESDIKIYSDGPNSDDIEVEKSCLDLEING